MFFFPRNIKKFAIKTIDIIVAAHQHQPSAYIVPERTLPSPAGRVHYGGFVQAL
jgi:hypothetical protein